PILQRQTGNLPTYRIKSREDNGLRCIINDDFYTRSRLKCTDVATLSADNATLDLVVLDIEDGDRVFDGAFRSRSLYRLNNHFLGFLSGRQLSFVNNVFDLDNGFRTCFLFKVLNELRTGLRG